MKNQVVNKISSKLKLTRAEHSAIELLFSDKVGIINAILERKELSSYGLAMFQSLSTHARTLFKVDREVSSGGLGINFDKKNAFLACIGEAVERYCLSYADEKKLKFSHYIDLPIAERPPSFHLYTNEQYKKLANFINPLQEKIHWTYLKNIDSTRTGIWWPASLVYIPFKFGVGAAEITSTGLAAGFDSLRPLQSGLLELIERDALMINFLKQLNPPELDIQTITGTNAKLIKKISKRFNVRIYKMYTDLNIPVFVSLIWRTTKSGMHYGIGGSAHLSSDEAIKKSLIECLFTEFYSKNLMDLRKNNKNKINALYEHFLYYQNDFAKFKKLLFNSKKISYTPQVTTFDALVKDIQNKGYNIYTSDLTTPDIDSTGFKVIRVVIPEFIDLSRSHTLIRENADRFESVPRKLGIKSLKGFWHLPHPFP